MAYQVERKLEEIGGPQLTVQRLLSGVQKRRTPVAEKREATVTAVEMTSEKREATVTAVEMNSDQANEISGTDSQLSTRGAFGRLVRVLLVGFRSSNANRQCVFNQMKDYYLHGLDSRIERIYLALLNVNSQLIIHHHDHRIQR